MRATFLQPNRKQYILNYFSLCFHEHTYHHHLYRNYHQS